MSFAPDGRCAYALNSRHGRVHGNARFHPEVAAFFSDLETAANPAEKSPDQSGVLPRPGAVE